VYKSVDNILKCILRRTGNHCRDLQGRLGWFILKNLGESTALGNMKKGLITHGIFHYEELGDVK